MLAHDRTGSGEPLLLLHGIGSRRQVWAPVVPALAAEHEVIAVDLPGFGASAPLAGTTDIVALVDAVEAFAGELGLDRWHVAGNSTGGGVALELAHRGSVASATAVSPIGFWSTRERAYGRASLRNARAIARVARDRGLIPTIAGTAAGRTFLLSQTFAKPWRLEPQDVVESVDAFLDCPAWDDVMASFVGYVAPFDHGTVPVTVAWGTRDRLLLPRQARRARTVMRRARHVWLDGCGHAPFSDDPEQVAGVLLAGAR
jgi:pimeloyl-ACP methyl ester carboxylesterase